uniref:Uncharacterized protein n=1 Tax=Parascaris equorum TaxID=6256 RepID=A0A914R5U6_PAREQ
MGGVGSMGSILIFVSFSSFSFSNCLYDFSIQTWESCSKKTDNGNRWHRKRISAISAHLRFAFSGFSGLATIIYSGCREFLDNGMCWVSPSEFFWIEWIIMGPCLFALCVCFKSQLELLN